MPKKEYRPHPASNISCTIPSTYHSEGAAILLVTSHAEGATTYLLLRVHADEIVSHPSARVILVSQNKTFEELLLDEVNQMSNVKLEGSGFVEGRK
jgi:hypothetical protein